MASPYYPQGTTGQAVQNNAGQTIGGYDSQGNLATFGTTADKLINPPKAAILQPQQPTIDPYSFVNNLKPAIDQANDGLIRANTQEEAARTDVLNRLLGVQDPHTQQTYDSRFNALHGNDYVKQFTDANTRLAQLTGYFNTGMQKISSAPGQSQVFEGLQLNEAGRQKAVEVGNQALLVQALQGNISTAQQIARDTAQFASEDRANKLSSLISQFQSLDGIVQGQEKQLIDNAKVKAEQEYEQLKRTQATIDTAIQSGGASVEEMQQLTRTDLTDEQKMGIAQTIINRTAGEKTAFDRKLQMKSDFGVVGQDEYGNDIYGFVNPYNQSVTSVNSTAIDSTYADGTKGGQCVAMVRNLCTMPTPDGRVGNEWSEKKSNVDKYGIAKQQVLSGDIQPGDVLYYDPSIGSPYGHVETVTAVNGSQITAKGSNLDGKETIYTRALDLNNMPSSFYGSVRAQLKDQFGGQTDTSALSNAMKSIAPRLSAAAAKSASISLNQMLKQGDSEGAKQFVFSTAISSLPVEQQNAAFGRLEAIDSLNHIKQLLSQYQSKGGDTNVLTGTEEQIAQKLGNTTNPELANIGNQIHLAIVAYRKAVSGAAFTPAESKEYEDIFPSTKNIGTLNDAKISSILEAFNLNQKSVLSNVIGPRNYDAIIGTSSTSPSGDSGTSAEDAYINSIINGGSSTPAPKSGGFDYYNSVLKPLGSSVANSAPLRPIKTAYNYLKTLF